MSRISPTLVCYVVLLLMNVTACSDVKSKSELSDNASSSPTPTPEPNLTSGSPTVTSVSPSSAGVWTSTTVTITGSQFLTGATVKIGEQDCSSVVVVSSTSITCLAPPAASAGTVNVTVTNSLESQPTGVRDGTLTSAYTYTTPTQFKLFIGSQTNSQSLIKVLTFNVTSNAITESSVFDVTNKLGTDGLRLFVDLSSSSFLIGGYNSTNSTWTIDASGTTSSTAVNLVGRTGGELSDIMGGCTLPNGHLVAGSYTNQLVAEYDAQGQWQRNIAGLSYYLSDCVSAGSSQSLYLMDYDANSDQASVIRKFNLSNSAWAEVQSLNLTTFGGGTQGSGYSLVKHTNGHLYLAPQNPGTTAFRKVVRCNSGDLTSCEMIGNNWPVNYPNGAVEGMTQIPYQNDILLVDNTSLYRMDITSGTLTPIFTLNIPSHAWTRHLRIRPFQ